MTDKVQENALRRRAERQGLRLVKSRRRDPAAHDYGCFGLVDIQTNGAVFGFGALGLEASAEEITEFLHTARDG